LHEISGGVRGGEWEEEERLKGAKVKCHVNTISRNDYILDLERIWVDRYWSNFLDTHGARFTIAAFEQFPSRNTAVLIKV